VSEAIPQNPIFSYTDNAFSSPGGYSKPNTEYGNYYLETRRRFLSKINHVSNPTDPSIENMMYALIGCVDDIEYQKELQGVYDKDYDNRIKRYCAALNITEDDVDNVTAAQIRWTSNIYIMGKIQIWFGKHLAFTKPISVGVIRAPHNWLPVDYDIDKPPVGEYFNPAKHYAEIITGKITRDVSQLTVGGRGSGKSEKDLSLGEIGGMWTSLFVDNDGSRHGGMDYFNIDYVACIDEGDAAELMSRKDRYIWKQFDDIGVGWNARNFGSKANKDKNDVFQINRVNNTVQLMSVPDTFLLDKVPRHLISHYCEMVFSDEMKRRYEWTEMKLFIADKNFRSGTQLTSYPIFGGARIERVVAPRCSKRLAEEYLNLRAEKTRRQIDKEGEKEAKQQNIAYDGRAAKAKARCELLFPTYFCLREGGVSHEKALAQSNITSSQFREWKRNGWITWDEKEWVGLLANR
jgi:hypothetical protein